MSIKNMLSKQQRRRLYGILNLLPDSVVVRLQYYAVLGRWPDLKNPRRFTEKLQWYKLNYRVPLLTQCSDKYRVREYIEKKGYGDCLPELYQVHDRVDEIDFDALPSSFAIKCNNGSGTNIFIPDKSRMDKAAVIAEGKTWNEVNTIAAGREWAYMNIVPKVIVEELLVASDEAQKNSLYDYKILCFNGTPRVIWVDADRATAHKRAFFDPSWKQLDVLSNYPPIDFPLPKPYGFERMLSIAEDISKDFPFVRVDFYSLNQRIYLGELTMYPFSGCVQFHPDSFDFELGSYFTLPEKTIVSQ